MEFQPHADEDPPAMTGGRVTRALQRSRRARWLWLAAWLGATALLLIFQRFDLAGVGRQLVRARPGWIGLAALANFLVPLLLATLWARLLPAGRNVRWRKLAECSLLAFAAMNTLPLGGGHALAIGLLSTSVGLGFDGAVSLMALEQLCEGGAKLSLLVLALLAAPLPEGLRRAAWILGAGLIAGTAALLWVARHPRDVASGWRARWSRHLEALLRPRVFAGAFGFALAIKLVELVAIWAVQRSLGVELPLATVPVVLAAVSFATMISVAPANLGVYEAAAFAAYRWFGVAPATAVALAVLHHACFLAPMVLPGYALTAWRAFSPRRPAN
jgi:uncharacterized membrane protein YbhN (UPF0104 family)